MPSPFPGMAPYIETPELWPDFYNNLASEMQAQLHRLIQPRYFARLISYVIYEVIEVGEGHGVRPTEGRRVCSANGRAALDGLGQQRSGL
jgi:hypothetical protein